jgi:hypothetical protein
MLEAESDGELDRPWTTYLIQRTESDAETAKACRQGPRGATKLRAGQTVFRKTKVRMIEKIESFCAKLQVHLLVKIKLAPQCEIDLL